MLVGSQSNLERIPSKTLSVEPGKGSQGFPVKSSQWNLLSGLCGSRSVVNGCSSFAVLARPVLGLMRPLPHLLLMARPRPLSHVTPAAPQDNPPLPCSVSWEPQNGGRAGGGREKRGPAPSFRCLDLRIERQEEEEVEEEDEEEDAKREGSCWRLVWSHAAICWPAGGTAASTAGRT